MQAGKVVERRLGRHMAVVPLYAHWGCGVYFPHVHCVGNSTFADYWNGMLAFAVMVAGHHSIRALAIHHFRLAAISS